MKKNNYIAVLLLMGLCFILFPSQAWSKETANDMGYTVSAVPNSKQIDPEQTYFYLQTAPGEEQQLKVKVKSTRKDPVKIKIYATDAYTGDQGTVEYTADPKELDSSLKDSVSSLLKIEEPSITVENFEEKEVVIPIDPSKGKLFWSKNGCFSI